MTNLHPRELEERNPIILLVIRPIIGRSNREVKNDKNCALLESLG